MDCQILQDDFAEWETDWHFEFNISKCHSMIVTRHPPDKQIQFDYALHQQRLELVQSAKYIGITITDNLDWGQHISEFHLRQLRQWVFFCENVKEAAYKGIVRPILEYGSSVWDPHTGKLQEELEKVRNRAARFVTRNYVYETGSMTDILGQLKWESLRKRRKDNRLILLYKGLKGKARIPTDDLIPKTRRGRNQQYLTPAPNVREKREKSHELQYLAYSDALKNSIFLIQV